MTTNSTTTDLTSMLADLAETRDWLRKRAAHYKFMAEGCQKRGMATARDYEAWLVDFTRRADAVDAVIAFIEKTKE